MNAQIIGVKFSNDFKLLITTLLLNFFVLANIDNLKTGLFKNNIDNKEWMNDNTTK